MTAVVRARAQPRPLDALRSLKVKLGVVVVGSVGATVAAIDGFLLLGAPPWIAFAGGLVVSLAVIQVLAHGMVLPLREMAAATRAMAGGDYSRRVTATAQDEVGDLARSFNTMAAQLAEVERQRRELVANMSHELRTPLAALRARLENLADGVEALDAAAVTAMARSAERLSRLVDQLLELNRLESGATAFASEPFSVLEVAREAADEVQPVEPGVAISVAVDEGLEARGDEAAIHRVLTNLLTNAVRHSPEGGTVAVRARATPTGVRLEVADEGDGVPPEERDRIFERFYRLDAARAAGDGGAGLGLAIVRSIVERHRGSVRAQVAQPDGSGCVMVVDLPF